MENAQFLLKIVENPEMFGHELDNEEHESDEVQTEFSEQQRVEGKTQYGHEHEHDLGMSIDMIHDIGGIHCEL